MGLAIPLSLEHMEARPVDELPSGSGWQFEPKWDGFRAIAFRDGDKVFLQSRNQRPLGRYFPELICALRSLPITRFVLDGEIIIRDRPFDELQLRRHTAASRISHLAETKPATFVAFDLLADQRGESLLDLPLSKRNKALDSFFKSFPKDRFIVKSRSTGSQAQALKWIKGAGHGLDGIVAKRSDERYRPGERAMLKYKLWQTLDCVVGGYYPKQRSRRVEYLLLGLYDDAGRLNYLGRAGINDDGGQIREMLAPLVGGSGFTGRSPGGKSRWSNHERRVIPLHPRLVVEASVDHIENRKFRHGARLLRWRDDKKPRQCTMDQLSAAQH